MKKILFYTLMLTGFAAMVVFYSCKRTLNDQEFQGPGIIGAPEGFIGVVDAFTACNYNQPGCTTPLDDTTNTAKQLVMGQPFPNASNVFPAFHATLSHRVTWYLTVKGNKSGAIKIFTATSQIIDQTNALWMGRTDGNEFMNPGEGITATLTFLNSELSYTLGLKILNNALGPYNYEKNPVAPAVKGKVMEDYDQSSIGTNFGMRTTYADLNDGNVKAPFDYSS